MSQIHKIIFFTGAIETLSYFSKQMEVHFKEQGYATFFVDMDKAEGTRKHLQKFCKPGETALITFNFIGLSNEAAFKENNGKSIWENMQVKVFNLLVDHPLYYHKQLCKPKENMILFCLDRQHVKFVEQFYPGVEAYFLPTAGNILLKEGGECYDSEMYRKKRIPYEKRKMDVVFIGNYASLPDLKKHFPMQSQEYIDFYYRIINDIIDHPSMPLDEALIKHLQAEIKDISNEDLKTGMVSLLFVDLYVRNFYRAETIRALAENGVKVHLFGKNWEKIICSHRENLILNGGQVDSAACVEAVRNSKIALNTMPWFKDGAHDRIFTAMLQGSVALTDDSIYLRERFKDGENICFYELAHLEKLKEQVEELLAHPKEAEEIAECGYETAWKFHTWKSRAEAIAAFFSGTIGI